MRISDFQRYCCSQLVETTSYERSCFAAPHSSLFLWFLLTAPFPLRESPLRAPLRSFFRLQLTAAVRLNPDFSARFAPVSSVLWYIPSKPSQKCCTTTGWTWGWIETKLNVWTRSQRTRKTVIAQKWFRTRCLQNHWPEFVYTCNDVDIDMPTARI